VIKDDYHYPSQILFEKQQDEKYFGLYHGGSIVADDKMILNYNIPLDPDRKELSAVSIIKRRSLRKFQLALALIGPIAAVISLIIQPTWWVGGLLIAQIFLTVGFRKAAIPLRLKNWGTIIEATTNRPISQAVVRIFDKQYNKLLETQITDSHGRYGFLVTKNNYYLTVEKVGYVKYVSENIVISSDDGGLIARNVELNKS
jgi:uncharacterized membrane protein YfbV (UPF0208 family)